MGEIFQIGKNLEEKLEKNIWVKFVGKLKKKLKAFCGKKEKMNKKITLKVLLAVYYQA